MYLSTRAQPLQPATPGGMFGPPTISIPANYTGKKKENWDWRVVEEPGHRCYGEHAKASFRLLIVSGAFAGRYAVGGHVMLRH